MNCAMIPWWNWVKLKIADNAFLTLHWKRQDSLTSETGENAYPFALISLFVVSN